MRRVVVVFLALAAVFMLGASTQADARGKGVFVYKADRYPYRYAPRGYYPYYNSGHWKPTAHLRRRRDCCRPLPTPPPYYQAWGYPHRHYRHREWHYRHHGRHRLGHW